MGDAWLYASRPDAAWEVGSALAELGFSPRYLDGRHELRPSADGGCARRPPELAVVVAARGEEPLPQLELLRRLRSTDELGQVPLLLALDPEHLGSALELPPGNELLVKPFSVQELRVRVARATSGGRAQSSADVVRAGSLELNLATYEAEIAGRPVAFTRMEYELLKFLVTHPNRVFSREALLSRVWGYDYYGGARTVDVHVRRLRAKVGHDHAPRIKTVRSVGYLFDVREPAQLSESDSAVAVG
jgi:two-component system, OmpR family, alkaline phosphatase synthesis response regulator PhoP